MVNRDEGNPLLGCGQSFAVVARKSHPREWELGIEPEVLCLNRREPGFRFSGNPVNKFLHCLRIFPAFGQQLGREFAPLPEAIAEVGEMANRMRRKPKMSEEQSLRIQPFDGV